MSKKQVAAPKAPKGDIKLVKRKRRNSMQRQCLPKALKTMFSGSDRATFRTMLAAWKEGRKKVSVSSAA